MTIKLPDTEFVRVGPETFYPGFEMGKLPDFGDFCGTTGDVVRDIDEAEQEWYAALDRYTLAEGYVRKHKSVPKEFLHAFEMPKEALRWVNAIIGGATPNTLIMFGAVGPGKSHGAAAAACLLATRWADHRPTGATPLTFISASRLLKELKNFDADAGARIDLQRDAMEGKVLVLDDFGRSGTTDYDHETLTTILGNRRELQLPTIITSNVEGVAGLEELYGDHLSSRILGGANLLQVRGPDRRRMQAPL